MVKQFLLNADGTCPSHIDRAALESAGVIFVIPTSAPIEYGTRYQEGEPVKRGGAWFQTWVDVADEYPAEDVPPCVTMRQARLALLGVGLLGTVSKAIESLPPAVREAAQIEWEYSTEVNRHSPFVHSLGGALKLTPSQLDEIFINASKL